MSAIHVQGLTRRFGDETVLDDLDLVVETGAVVGLLGPNGAGKTTTVRILTTLLRAHEGTVVVAGADVRTDPHLVRARIGLVGQHAAVDEVLTGRQNLVLLGRLHHLGTKVARRRAGELLERFGLTEAGDRSASTYSGGMRRKLDLALGLVTAPDILFLDEPTTGLDPRAREEVWAAVRALDATVLLTTQYLEEADRLADDVVLLDGGRKVAQGSPAELKAQHGADATLDDVFLALTEVAA